MLRKSKDRGWCWSRGIRMRLYMYQFRCWQCHPSLLTVFIGLAYLILYHRWHIELQNVGAPRGGEWARIKPWVEQFWSFVSMVDRSKPEVSPKFLSIHPLLLIWSEIMLWDILGCFEDLMRRLSSELLTGWNSLILFSIDKRDSGQYFTKWKKSGEFNYEKSEYEKLDH